MSITVAELARITGGTAEGDASRLITGANALDAAGPEDVSFVANKKALDSATRSTAGCLFTGPAFDVRGGWSLIRVAEPRVAFARALDVLYPRQRKTPGVHASSVVAASAQLAEGVSVGPLVSIGEGVRIGPGTTIGDGCTIGSDVTVGTDCILHPGVRIYDRVKIGDRVILHSGCVIGADGFGFALAGDHYEKFPQVGTVEIGDDVEIGANCCIDRAALGVTTIGSGTKLDNLVHVAHNCRLGRHVVVAAQTGFSGSVTVGDYAVIGGQAGIGEKANIESRAIVGGKAGVLTSQTVRAGEPVWGIPARPLRGHLKSLAHLQKLPELKEIVRELRQRLEKLESVRI